MSTLANTLLDFIISLLKDPEAAQRFSEDPQGELDDAGLGDVCGADVDAIAPMLADYAPAGMNSFAGHGGHGGGHGGGHPDDHDHGYDYDKDHEHGHKPDHGYKPDHNNGPEHDSGYLAIEHIKYVQQNYTYHATTTLDFSHSVWGDQYNIWAEDSTVAIAGDGGIAAGDDVRDSSITSTASFNDISNSGDGAAVGVGNAAINDGSFNENSGDDVAIGSGASVTDSHDTEIVNSGNEFGGGGNVLADEGTAVAIQDDTGNVADHGGNAGEAGTVTDVDDSFNTDDSFDTEVDDVNVALGDGSVAGGEDNDAAAHNGLAVQDVAVEGEDNQFAGGDIDQSHDIASDIAVVVDDAVGP